MNFKYTILAIALTFGSCIYKPRTEKNTMSVHCEYCDSLKQVGLFEYPYRTVDKNLDGVPLSNKSISKDSLQALTDIEVKQIQSSLFCFLGLKDSLVFSYFSYNMNQIIWEKNKTKQSVSFTYNRGSYYFIKNSKHYLATKNDKGTEFWIIGEGQFNLEFKQVNNEYIYSGNKQDTVRLAHCINKNE